ncbi:MAG: response regulator [Desulfocapsa sp.]|nr:response regulator [Desulfocapsa sp.]
MENNNKTKILIAEDDKILRKTVAWFIAQNDYIPLEAEDGHEALKIFRQVRPALILTDLQMPVMSGFALLQAVSIESPRTPVIIFSGAGEKHDVISALRYGAVDYISKPVEDADFLMDRIEKALLKAQCRDKSESESDIGVWSFSHAAIETIQFKKDHTSTL